MPVRSDSTRSNNLGNGFRYLGVGRLHYEVMLKKIEDCVENYCEIGMDTGRALEAALRYFTRGETIEIIAEIFNTNETKIERAIIKIAQLIRNMEIDEIKLNNQTWNRVQRGFVIENGFPNCFGAFGVIRSKVKTDKKILYMPVKKTVTFYTVADTEHRIVLAEAVFGSDKMFSDSKIYHKLEADQLNIPDSTYMLNVHLIAPRVFVARDNFPQLHNLCVPYPKSVAKADCLKKLYNEYIEYTVENADRAVYCLMKKFKILKKLHLIHHKYVEDIFMACVKLHNYKINFMKPLRCDTYRLLPDVRVTNGRENKCGAEETRSLMATFFWVLSGISNNWDM